jgi:cytoskeletal protein CcmA (bactofilin family)
MPPDHQSHSSDEPSGTSTIGEGLVIDGNITSNSPLHIDGRVHGDVQCASLVLGENSEIAGNVVAEDVVIRGRLIGAVRGVRVILQSNCHVEGDLVHSSLAMEQGAHFEGKSRRSEDPLAAEPRSLERPENTSKGFIRSLNESNDADDHIN